MFGIHGIDDPIAAYGGVPGADGFLSFTDTLAYWAKANHCTGSPTSGQLVTTGHDSTTVATLTYGG
ncbi:MAG: hypothetical protein E6I82_00330, partial [Chloroflexi bacterium]